LPGYGINGIQYEDYRSLKMRAEQVRLFLILARGSGFPCPILDGHRPWVAEKICPVEGKTFPQKKGQIRHLNKPKPWLCAEQRLKIFL
jgi:hypothetical protein